MLFFASTSAFFGWFSKVLWCSLDSMVFPLLTLVVRVVFVSSALMLLIACFIDALIINNTKETWRCCAVLQLRRKLQSAKPHCIFAMM